MPLLTERMSGEIEFHKHPAPIGAKTFRPSESISLLGKISRSEWSKSKEAAFPDSLSSLDQDVLLLIVGR